MIKYLYKLINPRYQKLFLDYQVDLKPRYGHGKPSHTELYEIINANRSEYINILKSALKYKEFIWKIKDQKQNESSISPVWNNGFLPGLDIIGLYTLVAEIKPKRYIEIGSGNSTKVVYKSIKENNLSTEIISIDPKPRVEIDNLVSKVIREPLEKSVLDIVLELDENDILFIDNSHRILPNSDSMVFFLEIFPRLKKGVIVHLHDIYLPYDYPQFMCDRFYSEQYGLAMYLLANPRKFKPILPNYFIYSDKELLELISPVWDNPNLYNVERHGGSFWIRIEE